jgi:hypothetical protein
MLVCFLSQQRYQRLHAVLAELRLAAALRDFVLRYRRRAAGNVCHVCIHAAEGTLFIASIRLLTAQWITA